MGFAQGTEEKERKRRESVIPGERYIRVPLYSRNSTSVDTDRVTATGTAAISIVRLG